MQQSQMIIALTVIVSIVVLAAAAILLVKCVRRFRHNRRTGFMDEMEGHDFEFFCAELLEQQGCLAPWVWRRCFALMEDEPIMSVWWGQS